MSDESVDWERVATDTKEVLHCTVEALDEAVRALNVALAERDRAVEIRADYECSACGGQVFDTTGDACECVPNDEPSPGVGCSAREYSRMHEELKRVRAERDQWKQKASRLDLRLKQALDEPEGDG